MTKLLLTAEEAAEMLGVGRSKIYELLRIGVLESVRIGACRRIPAAALDEYVAHLRDQVQTTTPTAWRRGA